jgi:hypothetical protein
VRMLNSLKKVNWFGVEPRLHTHAKPSVYTHTNPKILITALWQIFLMILDCFSIQLLLILFSVLMIIILSLHSFI